MKRSYIIDDMCPVLLACAAGGSAQQLHWDNKECMDVKEIHPGMTGYGLTVFQGTTVERFNFTVVAVLAALISIPN